MVLALNEQGFLLNTSQWNVESAIFLAEQEHIVLTEAHWDILYFIRHFYDDYGYLPNARGFSKAIKMSLGEQYASSRYLLGLFPKGPLKYACKIAGLPKPPSCL